MDFLNFVHLFKNLVKPNIYKFGKQICCSYTLGKLICNGMTTYYYHNYYYLSILSLNIFFSNDKKNNW